MKKIISTLLMFIIFAIWCISTTMASFSMHNTEMDQKMDMDMTINSDCCSNVSSDCNKIIHECCISPFDNTSNIIWTNIQNNNDKKIKVISIDVLAIIQESLSYNYIVKLTSPPNIKFNWDNNSYISLTGIIKNNC